MPADPAPLARHVSATALDARRIDYVVSEEHPPSATETLRRAGARPGTQVVGVTVEPAAADVALHLDLERATPLVVLRRVVFVDQMPVLATTAHVPAQLAPGLADHVDAGASLYHVLRDTFRLRPRRRWSRASLEPLPSRVAARLDVPDDTVAWLLEGVDEDAERPHVAVEFTRSWLRADRVNVVLEHGRPPDVVR